VDGPSSGGQPSAHPDRSIEGRAPPSPPRIASQVTVDPISDPKPPVEGLDALSVVIPVFNGETWVPSAVDALLAAADSAGRTLDVVVVDDGSTDSTLAVLEDLAERTGIRVLGQANAGRLAARSAELALARQSWVLLLDSRVIMEPDSLSWLRQQISEHPERRVWCGHVDVETQGNSFAAFWSGLVKIGWRRYTANPRLVSFGAEEFNYFPEGTGCLLMPRDLLLDAVHGFELLYDAAHLASDDTRLLRQVASQQRIWLSPEFHFRYHGKTGARGFARQSYFRGTTFVDGYLGQPGVARRALIGAFAAALVLGAVAIRRPVVGAAGLAAACVAVPSAVHLSGGSRDEVRAATTLAPIFIQIFGAGVLRGLTLAAADLLRPSRSAPTE